MTSLSVATWNPMHGRPTLIILASLLLAACGSSQPSPPPTGQSHPAPAAQTTVTAPAQPAATHAQRTQRFHSVRLGFYIDYPAAMQWSVRFDSRYLANDSWKTYAPHGSKGAAVLMLTLPDSNDVTAGELRIGISSDAGAIHSCKQPPDSVRPSTRGTATINGTTFTTWHAADAAMSHYLKVHSYRTVHAGYCYAIDLLVTGTNPKVYSPPRTPPFTQKQAFARLHKALEGFHFTR